MKSIKPINPEIYLQQTMNNMFIHCFIIGFDWHFQYLNQTVAEISDTTVDSLLAQDIRKVFPANANQKVFDFFKLCLEEKTRIEFRASFTFNNGKTYWFRFKVNPIDIGIFIIANEITETVLAQEEIKKHKELLETAETIAHLGSWEVEIPSGTFYWSDESFKILEYTKGKTTPSYQSFIDRVHPDDRALVEDSLNELIKNFSPGEIVHRILLPDGKVKYLHQRWEIYYDEIGNPIRSVGTSQDITTQILSEISLKKSRLQYEQVVENINDGIIVYTTDEKILFVNKQFLTMFGMTKEDLAETKLLDFIADDYKEKIAEQHYKRIAGEKVPEIFEYKGKRKDGTERWFEARACNVIIDGKLVNIQFALRDITEQKNSTQKLEIQYEELRKINFELDRFVYSASHDLRAPLLSLLGLIELTERTSTSDELSDFIKMMKSSILRLDNSIKDMLAYSENSKSELLINSLEISKIIDCKLNHYEILIKSKSISVELLIEDDIPFYSDKTRVALIIKNLISNAINFQRNDELNKTIKISFKSTPEFGHLRVEDNGEGIPSDKTEKIFDMFYRNSEQSEGIGLGLYLCKEALTKLGGTIEVSSISGKASIFEVKIPNNYTQQ